MNFNGNDYKNDVLDQVEIRPKESYVKTYSGTSLAVASGYVNLDSATEQKLTVGVGELVKITWNLSLENVLSSDIRYIQNRIFQDGVNITTRTIQFINTSSGLSEYTVAPGFVYLNPGVGSYTFNMGFRTSSIGFNILGSASGYESTIKYEIISNKEAALQLVENSWGVV